MKIQVPEGMLKAACREYPGRNFDYADEESYGVFTRPILKAALRWLSENPIVPTIKQLEKIWDSQPDSTAEYPYWQKIRETMAEWQRRMFLAPEVSDTAKTIGSGMLSVTFTSEDADYLIEQVIRASEPGYEPPRRT